MHQQENPEPTVTHTLLRLRNRAMVLRFQAYGGLLTIAVTSISLVFFLTSRTYDEYQVDKDVKKVSREPYSYKKMEERHSNLADKIDNLADVMEQRREYDAGEKKSTNNQYQRISSEINDIREIKKEIQSRLSNDRENMRLEIKQLKDERDDAIREKHENGRLFKMIGEAAFRVGAILVSFYFISILSNISKYLLRVADHLNAVADSIELLEVSKSDITKGIESLTPHPIDFHIDEALSIKQLKEFASLIPGGK